MGEKVNNELSKISKMKAYSKRKESLLSDLATAYISDKIGTLDESLIAVKSMRKALRATGYTEQQIDDYIIERSYITKADIRKMYNQSIYNDDMTIKSEVEILPAFHTDNNTTDLIIDELKSRPVLLSALQRGTSEAHLRQNLHIKNATLLINFYNKNKDIINEPIQ